VRQRILNLLYPAAALVALAALWEAAAILFRLPAYILPPPSAIARATAENAGFLLTHLLITLYEIALGFAGGVFLGFVTAVVIVHSPFLARMIYPLVVLTQSIPKITIAPVLLVWFGLGLGSKVALIVLMSFFPIVVNTVTGMTAVDPYALDLLRSLQAGRLHVFWLLRLPNALLAFFDGLKMAVTMSIIGAVLAEFIGSSQGIGWLILVSKSNMDLALSFAGIAVISIAAVVLFGVVGAAQRVTVHWQQAR
jgi:NitT/TauT family transport system permease protein